MPDVLIRDVCEETKARLTERAARNGRSMQAEMRLVLDDSVARPVGSSREERQDDSLGLASFEDSRAVASRIEKRKAIFESLEALNKRIDPRNLPDAAALMSQMRAEKEKAEDSLIAELREGAA